VKNDDEIIRGRVVFPGIVRGPIKVIKKKDDLALLSEGDIMVASMTTPEMISAMKKAIAFITDEGGITCHAAIIARELKKPCVIGTKVATQILHDGDQVEVDAYKGVIKIIKII
jgi:pyruvate,water dikinase